MRLFNLFRKKENVSPVEQAELVELKEGFREAAALGSVTLFHIFKRNESFFENNQDAFRGASDSMDSSLNYAEQGNYRMAWNCISEGLFDLVDKYPQLAASDEDIADGMRRILEISRKTLKPYWEKYESLF